MVGILFVMSLVGCSGNITLLISSICNSLRPSPTCRSSPPGRCSICARSTVRCSCVPSHSHTFLHLSYCTGVSIRGNPLLTMSRPPSAASSAPGTPTPRTAASGGATPIHTIVQNLPNLFQMYEKGTLSDTQVTQVRSI